MQFTHSRLVKFLAVVAMVTATPLAQSQTFSSGSTGADGALNLTTPGTIIFDPVALGLNPVVQNVFNFTTINIGAGVTVKLTSKVLTGPVYWLAQGAVTINGVVDLNGEDGHPRTSLASVRVPAAGGAGGYSGGVGGSTTVPAQNGNGPGGGLTIAQSYGSGGTFTGSQYLIPLIGGSGGSGENFSSPPPIGGGGGGGGGAILIASSTSIGLAGEIQVMGGSNMGGIGGGGGSGGAIRLMAPLVNVSGAVRAGPGAALGIAASPGLIRLEGFTVTFNPTNNLHGGNYIISTPFSTAVPAAPPSSLKVTSLVVGGVSIPINANPFSFPDATINSSVPVTVNVQAQFIPTGTAPKIIVMSETGPDQTVNCSALGGTLQQSTCSAQITFPTGGSRGFVKATW